MEWKGVKVLLVVVIGFFFSLGVMLIDYGASMKGTDGFAQTLLFSHIDARVTYHIGIVLVVGAFFAMTAVGVNEIKS